VTSRKDILVHGLLYVNFKGSENVIMFIASKLTCNLLLLYFKLKMYRRHLSQNNKYTKRHLHEV